MSPAIAGQLRELIDRDGPIIQSFAFRLTRNKADAEDLAQETYRKVAERWWQYNRERPSRPWCLTVLKHLHLDSLRRYETRNFVSLDRPISGEASSFHDTIPGTEEGAQELLERRETGALVQRTLKGMSRVHRTVLTHCDLDGVGYEQAARMVGIPLSTLRSRLHRARQAFRRQYQGPAYV